MSSLSYSLPTRTPLVVDDDGFLLFDRSSSRDRQSQHQNHSPLHHSLPSSPNDIDEHHHHHHHHAALHLDNLRYGNESPLSSSLDHQSSGSYTSSSPLYSSIASAPLSASAAASFPPSSSTSSTDLSSLTSSLRPSTHRRRRSRGSGKLNRLNNNHLHHSHSGDLASAVAHAKASAAAAARPVVSPSPAANNSMSLGGGVIGASGNRIPPVSTWSPDEWPPGFRVYRKSDPAIGGDGKVVTGTRGPQCGTIRESKFVVKGDEAAPGRLRLYIKWDGYTQIAECLPHSLILLPPGQHQPMPGDQAVSYRVGRRPSSSSPSALPQPATSSSPTLLSSVHSSSPTSLSLANHLAASISKLSLSTTAAMNSASSSSTNHHSSSHSSNHFNHHHTHATTTPTINHHNNHVNHFNHAKGSTSPSAALISNGSLDTPLTALLAACRCSEYAKLFQAEGFNTVGDAGYLRDAEEDLRLLIPQMAARLRFKHSLSAYFNHSSTTATSPSPSLTSSTHTSSSTPSPPPPSFASTHSVSVGTTSPRLSSTLASGLSSMIQSSTNVHTAAPLLQSAYNNTMANNHSSSLTVSATIAPPLHSHFSSSSIVSLPSSSSTLAPVGLVITSPTLSSTLPSLLSSTYSVSPSLT